MMIISAPYVRNLGLTRRNFCDIRAVSVSTAITPELRRISVKTQCVADNRWVSLEISPAELRDLYSKVFLDSALPVTSEVSASIADAVKAVNNPQ